MLVFQPNYFSVVLVLVCWISCPFAIVDTSLFASQLMFSFHLKHFVFQPLQLLCSFSFWLRFCLIFFSCFPACSSISSILFFSCHSLSVSFTFTLLLLLRHVMKCVHLFNSICWKGLTLSIPSESGPGVSFSRRKSYNTYPLGFSSLSLLLCKVLMGRSLVFQTRILRRVLKQSIVFLLRKRKKICFIFILDSQWCVSYVLTRKLIRLA